MITTENSSIFRLLTKESMLLTSSNILNRKEVVKEIPPYFKNFRTMRNHLSETLMLNDIQITSDYMSRWVVLKRRVVAVTSQRVLKVLFYVNILQCFFVVEHFTANAVSVAMNLNTSIGNIISR
jgi:hypothetical protein